MDAPRKYIRKRDGERPMSGARKAIQKACKIAGVRFDPKTGRGELIHDILSEIARRGGFRHENTKDAANALRELSRHPSNVLIACTMTGDYAGTALEQRTTYRWIAGGGRTRDFSTGDMKDAVARMVLSLPERQQNLLIGFLKKNDPNARPYRMVRRALECTWTPHAPFPIQGMLNLIDQYEGEPDVNIRTGDPILNTYRKDTAPYISLLLAEQIRIACLHGPNATFFPPERWANPDDHGLTEILERIGQARLDGKLQLCHLQHWIIDSLAYVAVNNPTNSTRQASISDEDKRRGNLTERAINRILAQPTLMQALEPKDGEHQHPIEATHFPGRTQISGRDLCLAADLVRIELGKPVSAGLDKPMIPLLRQFAKLAIDVKPRLTDGRLTHTGATRASPEDSGVSTSPIHIFDLEDNREIYRMKLLAEQINAGVEAKTRKQRHAKTQADGEPAGAPITADPGKDPSSEMIKANKTAIPGGERDNNSVRGMRGRT